MTAWGERTLLNVPLVFGDQPLGLLVLIETERERVFTADELELAAVEVLDTPDALEVTGTEASTVLFAKAAEMRSKRWLCPYSARVTLAAAMRGSTCCCSRFLQRARWQGGRVIGRGSI